MTAKPATASEWKAQRMTGQRGRDPLVRNVIFGVLAASVINAAWQLCAALEAEDSFAALANFLWLAVIFAALSANVRSDR